MITNEYNQQAWDSLVEQNNEWTQPVTPEQVEKARGGDVSIVLTPEKSVPLNWFAGIQGKKILCLASAGGQQAPILAAAGADVTVFDLSPKQLAQDTFVAERDGLSLQVEQGDMRDLSRFADESFDLIFHPCSNNFIPSLASLWQECARVLKPKGRLLAGFLNPACYLFDWFAAEQGKTVLKYRLPYADDTSLAPEDLAKLIAANEPLVYSHSLEQQIGWQCDAGLSIQGLYEDDWSSMSFSEYFPPAIATLAVKA